MAKSALWVGAIVVLAACHSKSGNKPPMVPAQSSSTADGGDDLSALSGDTTDAGASAIADAGGPATADNNGSKETPSADTPASGAAILQGNEEGARALLAQFVTPQADHLALTRSLRPTPSDYKSIFDAKTASKVEAGQAKEWNSNKAVIKPKAGQTEIKLWSATGAELAKGTGSSKDFPAEYKKAAKHIAPAVQLYRFKFVEPGKETGTAYDGLVFVNGHWVITPKPWRALDGKGGEEEPEKPAAKPKPKPKGKGKKH